MPANPAPSWPDASQPSLSRRRLLAAVMAPVLALIAFGSFVVHEKLEAYRRSADLLATAQLARAAHGLARELQEERTLSAQFIGSGRDEWVPQLEDQRIATDARLDDFRHLMVRPQIQGLFGRHRLDMGLGDLDALRAAVDGDAPVKAVLQGYGRLVSRVIGATALLSSGNPDTVITAYMDLGNAKDRIVRERAIGAAYMLEGRGNRDLLPLFADARAEARAFLESFRSHASAEQLKAFEEVVTGPVLDEVESLHVKALAGRLGTADAQAWLRAHTTLAEMVSRAEDRLAADMERDIGNRLDGAKTAFYVVGLAVLALVVFSIETLRRSERRAALAEAAAHKLFRAVEQSPVSVMITDTGGLIDYVNPAFSTMTGFGQAEVLGHNPRMLRSDVTPHQTHVDMWQTIRSGREWRGEVCNRRKDGSLYWESMTVSPVRGPQGDIVNYIALKEDVTEVKSLRQALEREHANVRRILESLNDGIALVGPDLRFEYANPALVAQFGPVDGLECRQYFADDDEGFPSCGGDTLDGRAEWRSRRTGRTYELTATPIYNQDGKASTLRVFHDITVRKEAEEVMDAARQAAEAANRAKTEFLAAMSHELRTPLNAIIGFSEIMVEQLFGELQPQYLEYVGDIHQSGVHLLQLINDILDIARLDVDRITLQEEEVDLTAVAAAATAMVAERAERGQIRVATRIADNLPLLWADGQRLKQILVNLLDNAVKFTAEGGRIDLTAHTVESGEIEVTVTDTGIGISAEDLVKVMSPFGQADSGMCRRFGGSGLGLPLASRLMSLHGGQLDIDSTPGRGTTVRLRFPHERLRERWPVG